MKIGDLVMHRHGRTGVVLYVNAEGGTIHTLCVDGPKWFVTSECEVISESR